ncbi:hypothetical protein TorRG33x02_092570 [Trema orientale]|uniref:Uncharacterized protein n=1 Tax=Trema orientale TaxID=63057 RepID=A0A2P5FBB1_TREOI|nr:hypothetical protein TorRG33x02_092570 [Trema orientale]
MSSIFSFPSTEEREAYAAEVRSLRRAIEDCDYHINLFTEGVQVDRTHMDRSIQQGELGIALEHMRREDYCQGLLCSYRRQKKFAEEQLKKLREGWFQKYGSPLG